MYVYVLSNNGVPLMPTSNCAKVRALLRQGRAKVVRRTPFTIRLLYDTTAYVQNITLGVDAGSKTIGVSATAGENEVYAAQVLPRNDVSNKLKARSEFRHARRYRKKRYRQARFDNRVKSKHKGWLAPSVENKINTHLQAISLASRLMPIRRVVIETAEFYNGRQKAEAESTDKQERYKEQNLRQIVLNRDNYTCRCCNGKSGKLYVVPAEGKRTGSVDDLYTVCKQCFENHAKTRQPYPFRKKRFLADSTFMGIMRKTLIARAREMFRGIEIEETFGSVTKGIREQHDIPKSYINDARCISGKPLAKPLEYFYLFKAVRSHNRQIHKATISKGGKRKLNQTPKYVFGFQLFDKVRCKGSVGFVFGRRTTGAFRIVKLDGEVLSTGINYKKLKLLEGRKSLLCELVPA